MNLGKVFIEVVGGLQLSLQSPKPTTGQRQYHYRACGMLQVAVGLLFRHRCNGLLLWLSCSRSRRCRRQLSTSLTTESAHTTIESGTMFPWMFRYDKPSRSCLLVGDDHHQCSSGNRSSSNAIANPWMTKRVGRVLADRPRLGPQLR